MNQNLSKTTALSSETPIIFFFLSHMYKNGPADTYKAANVCALSLSF